MEKPHVKKLFSFLLLPALVLFASKAAYGQGSPVSMPNARANAIRYIKSSFENISQEETKVFTTNDKYVRFMMAPHGTSFVIEQSYRNSPQQAAYEFRKTFDACCCSF